MADKKKKQTGKKTTPGKKGELSTEELKKVAGGLRRRTSKKTS